MTESSGLEALHPNGGRLPKTGPRPALALLPGPMPRGYLEVTVAQAGHPHTLVTRSSDHGGIASISVTIVPRTSP